MKSELLFNNIQKKLKALSNPSVANQLKKFFKTGKGQYAEYDSFRGIYVPQLRDIVKKLKNVPLSVIKKLMFSKYHEDRMLGILLLIKKYKEGDEKDCLQVANFYLKYISCINNWDLVDISAASILGKHLLTRSRDVLYKMVHSKNMWVRRIAIVSTLAFIRQGDFKDATKLAQMLLEDKEELIHKAVGWILREIGKRNEKVELAFLRKHIKKIAPITLSYATERIPPDKRHAIYRVYYAQRQGHIT